MIVLDLCCEHEHRFEGWFASSDAMEAQRAQGQLHCPVCHSASVRRLPSAPHVRASSGATQVQASGTAIGPSQAGSRNNSAPSTATPAAAPSQEKLSKLNELLEQLREVAESSEDVGTEFADEARRIHHGNTPERAIRGQASIDDIDELLEEGISVLPAPPAKAALH